MIVHSASQLITIAGPPQRGDRLGDLAIIPNGAVRIQNEHITEVGLTKDLLSAYPDDERLDATNRVIMPGFVDPHTHLIWAGERAAEFEMRLQGKTYMEIMAAGGGILATVRATRDATLKQLKEETRSRVHTLFRNGTTTVEVKTGYGLELETELRQLRAALQLDQEEPMDLVPTFLGAHAVPPEFNGNVEAFTDHVCQDMLPGVKAWWAYNAPGKTLPFVDVFCETGVFNLAQSRRILENAHDLGFPLKIHADEFDNLGGASLAAELGAISADHLVTTSREDILALAKSDTVAVALPPTPFGLGHTAYTPAQDILKANGFLAIASDINPGPAWCESMQFVVALACRYLKLTPAQALASATLNAAKAIGLDHKIGSIEAGKQADLLILSANDYRHLGYRFGGNLVKTVIKKGIVFDF